MLLPLGQKLWSFGLFREDTRVWKSEAAEKLHVEMSIKMLCLRVFVCMHAFTKAYRWNWKFHWLVSSEVCVTEDAVSCWQWCCGCVQATNSCWCQTCLCCRTSQSAALDTGYFFVIPSHVAILYISVECFDTLCSVTIGAAVKTCPKYPRGFLLEPVEEGDGEEVASPGSAEKTASKIGMVVVIISQQSGRLEKVIC